MINRSDRNTSNENETHLLKSRNLNAYRQLKSKYSKFIDNLIIKFDFHFGKFWEATFYVNLNVYVREAMVLMNSTRTTKVHMNFFSSFSQFVTTLITCTIEGRDTSTIRFHSLPFTKLYNQNIWVDDRLFVLFRIFCIFSVLIIDISMQYLTILLFVIVNIDRCRCVDPPCRWSNDEKT